MPCWFSLAETAPETMYYTHSRPLVLVRTVRTHRPGRASCNRGPFVVPRIEFI